MDAPANPSIPDTVDPAAVGLPTGVRGKLAAHKRDNSGERTTTLPETGVTVTYPGFIPHDRVMNASKLAGKKRDKVGKILIAQLCQFEGEKLTADEIGTDLPNADVVHLTNLIFGDDAANEDGEGN